MDAAQTGCFMQTYFLQYTRAITEYMISLNSFASFAPDGRMDKQTKWQVYTLRLGSIFTYILSSTFNMECTKFGPIYLDMI